MRCERLHAKIREFSGINCGNEEYLTYPESVPGVPGVEIQLLSIKQDIGQIPAGIYIELNSKGMELSQRKKREILEKVAVHVSDKLVGRRPEIKESGSPLVSTDSLFFYPNYQTKDGRLVIKVENYLPSEFEAKHRRPRNAQVC